jgi:arachidonate 15-lipoxygenase
MKNDVSTQVYEYDYNRFAESLKDPTLKYPMTSSVFKEDNSLTKGYWVEDVLTLLLRIRSNQALYDLEVNQNQCSALKLFFDIRFTSLIKSSNPWVKKIYAFIVRYLIPSQVKEIQSKKIAAPPSEPEIQGRKIAALPLEPEREEDDKIASLPQTSTLKIKDYQDLFQLIHLPIIAYQAEEDKIFSAQRVSGANPLVLKRLTAALPKFPVTEAQYQSVMGSSDSLQTALAENRLYITDYEVLNEIVCATDTIQKYIYHPIALFAVEPGKSPNSRLIPVAIQCEQTPSNDNPIFVAPNVKSSLEEQWAWQIAKLTVQIADANYHEFISHLGGTHLRMEPLAIATYRKLPATHPLGKLLLPHFEGTLFINDSAVKGLVNPGGTVDKVAAGTLKSSIMLSVKGAKNYPYIFNESALPKVLKARGTDDVQCLPNYPYRDDGLLIWNAISEWVSSYLSLFYVNDSAVQNDTAIQDWIRDLTDSNGGQMEGIGEQIPPEAPGKIETLAYLIEAVTLIIFTGSANHAAVNFPQSLWMTYMPNMPLAGYQPAPKTTVGITEQDYLNFLPPLSQAEKQMNMTYLLGSVYYTKLGYYDKPEEPYFADARVKQLLKVFQNKLISIELEISDRNNVRPITYKTLLPSLIPQSINI